MQHRNVAREVGLVVASLGVLVHWLDPAPALLATVLIVATAAAGTGPIVGEWRPWRMPLIPMVLPALAAFSIAGIAHTVSPVPWLGIDFVVGWAAVTWVFGLETAPDVLTAPESSDSPDGAVAVATAPPTVRLRPRRRAEFDLPEIVAEPVVVNTPELPPHPHPLAVRVAAMSLAFLGFVAAGSLVPDGLALDRQSLSTLRLAEYVALNAAIAGLVGYRLASLASPHRFDRIIRVVAFFQYAVVMAFATAVLRSLDLPRLFVPALLTLAVYMVTDVRESPDPVTKNLGLIQELVWLVVAALAVIVWGLLAS
jgi:hypothetical protein